MWGFIKTRQYIVPYIIVCDELIILVDILYLIFLWIVITIAIAIAWPCLSGVRRKWATSRMCYYGPESQVDPETYRSICLKNAVFVEPLHKAFHS